MTCPRLPWLPWLPRQVLTSTAPPLGNHLHDCTCKARITQLHYDATTGIVFRQSRPLNMGSETFDAPDVFLFLRWLNCLPIGNTKLGDAPARQPRALCSYSGSPESDLGWVRLPGTEEDGAC